MTTRKQYDSHFKVRVALEAIRNQHTIAEIASEYGVHANQISKWKKRVLDELPEIFSNKREKTQQNNLALQDELYRQIGQLKALQRFVPEIFNSDQGSQFNSQEFDDFSAGRWYIFRSAIIIHFRLDINI